MKKSFISIILLLVFISNKLFSQTELNTGDIAVVGVNANNFACSGTSTEDNISIVFFKDIVPGTEIDITDNGWERVNAGLWGNTEGTIRATRTGVTIPAGTIVTFKFTSTYVSLFPDADWSFSSINGMTTLNMNSGGDQLYFMQGGNWSNPNSGLHNSSYSGDILFGFNTKTTWVADGTTQQSNLYPNLGCFSMAPTGGATDYIKYTGDTTGTDQKSWVVRINNPANWTSYASCANYIAGSYNYLSNIKFNITAFFDVNAGNDSTICYYSGSFSLGGTPAGGTWSGTGVTSGMFDPLVSGAGTYTVTYTYDDIGCLYSDTKKITVLSTDASWTSPLNWCESGGNINLTTLITGQTGGTWTGSGVTGNTFNPSSLNGAIPITYIVTNGSCSDTSTQNININPDANINLTSVAGTDTQTICINTPLTNITYNIGGGGTGANVTGLPTGITGIFNGGIFTISGTPTVSGTFNFNVTTTGICNQVNANGTITVNPDATLTLTSLNGTDNQTICRNNSLTNITYSISGSGTGANVTGLPNGVTANYNSGTLTISGIPVDTGTFVYNVTTTGICLQTSAGGAITVNPNATIALTSGTGTNFQTICNNNLITNITYLISGGGTGANVVGLPSGVTGNYNSDTLTISGTPLETGTYNYIVYTTGICSQDSASGTITITTNPTASISYIDSSFCSSVSQALVVQTGSGGGTYSAPNGLIIDSLTGTISPSLSNSGTYLITYIILPSGGCPQINANTIISINPVPISSYIITNVSCYGLSNGAIDLTVTDGTLPFNYQWSNLSTNEDLINIPSGTYYYTVTDTKNCIDSGVVNITEPTLLIASSIYTPILCYGDSSLITITANGGTTPYSGTGNYTETAGTYNYTVTDNNGCVSVTNAPITEPQPILISDTSIITNNTGSINITVSGGITPYNFEWSNSSTSEDLTNLTNGVYIVTITDSNLCTQTDSINISIQENPLIIPNVITPNNDKKNDTWQIKGIEQYEQIKILIFNRWGDIVYKFDGTTTEYSDVNKQWDGTTSKYKLPMGSYIYIIDLDNGKLKFNGIVSVIY